MLGVIGNLISWRLIGIETLRFILAKIPSVGFTSQRSSFCSADKPVLPGENALPLVLLQLARARLNGWTVSQASSSSTASRCLTEQLLRKILRCSLGRAHRFRQAGCRSSAPKHRLLHSIRLARRCNDG